MTADKVYLRLVRDVMKEGRWCTNRTAERTLSVFVPATMKFDLQEGFPLLKTKTMNFESIKEELLWIMRGSTNANELKTKIWKGNTSREFLDKRGLNHYEVGDLGPGYGFQMRHSGAEYEGMRADYTGKGIDQLSEAVKLMKEEPDSRQNVISLWSAKDTKKMALPPCHYSVVFRVYDKKYLCAHMQQRSGDVGLGVPYNIASYSILMHILANEVGLVPSIFAHTISDAHIYESHVKTLENQLLRENEVETTPQPRLVLKAAPGTPFHKVKAEDICLEDYFPVKERLLPVMHMVP